MGAFFRGDCLRRDCARLRDHLEMMRGKQGTVNTRGRRRPDWPKKKPGSIEPGLRYWPREADTITFQEGLLNSRATGGGGHMRNATDQRGDSMIPISARQQPSEPHV